MTGKRTRGRKRLELRTDEQYVEGNFLQLNKEASRRHMPVNMEVMEVIDLLKQ